MIAIGLDPSITGFGYAVIFEHSLKACGVWQTKKGTVPGQTVTADTAIRFDFLATSLLELVESQLQDDSCGPVVLFVESLGVFGDRFTTAIGQGRCLGLVDMIAAAKRIQKIEVAPSKVKKLANVGSVRRVEKTEVLEAVLEIYPNARELLPKNRNGKADLNASDAIAIAHIGSNEYRFRAQLRHNGSPW